LLTAASKLDPGEAAGADFIEAIRTRVAATARTAKSAAGAAWAQVVGAGVVHLYARNVDDLRGIEHLPRIVGV
jgi:hypothetical protein